MSLGQGGFRDHQSLIQSNSLVHRTHELRGSLVLNGVDIGEALAGGGAQGPEGPPGAAGEAATIQTGLVSTLNNNQPATVSNSGDATNATFDFGIPKGLDGAPGAPGAPGQPGAPATITMGTVTTLPSNQLAYVTNSSSSSSAAVLNFGIPQGQPGSGASTAGLSTTGGTLTGNLYVNANVDVTTGSNGYLDVNNFRVGQIIGGSGGGGGGSAPTASNTYDFMTATSWNDPHLVFASIAGTGVADDNNHTAASGTTGLLQWSTTGANPGLTTPSIGGMWVPTFSFGGSFSFEVVVKFSATSSRSRMFAMGTKDEASMFLFAKHHLNESLLVHINPTSGSYAQYPYLTFQTNINSDLASNTNQYVHIVITHDSTSSAATVNTCYVNGAAQTINYLSTSTATRPFPVTTTTRSVHWIGRNGFGDSGSEVTKYVKHYNSVLSASEVSALHSNYNNPGGGGSGTPIGFAHKDYVSATGYALTQSSTDGSVELNAPSDATLTLAKGGTPKLTCDTNGNFIFASGVTFSGSVTGISTSVPSGTSATLIANGTVDNIAFQSLAGCSSPIQHQINNTNTVLTGLGIVVTGKQNQLQPVVNSPNGTGDLTLTGTFNDVLTYTPPDLINGTFSVGSSASYGTHSGGNYWKSGDVGWGSTHNLNWIGAAHSANFNPTDYAIIQEASGSTQLNCKAGRHLAFMSGNNHVGSYNSLANGHWSFAKFMHITGSKADNTPRRSLVIAPQDTTTLNNADNLTLFQSQVYSTHIGLRVDSGIYGSNLYMASDDRRKHNEISLGDGVGLAAINQLECKIYEKTEKLYTDGSTRPESDTDYHIEAGVIAQEVAQIPELAFTVIGGDYTDSDGATVHQEYALDYQSINTFAIKAIQELSAKVAALEARLNAA